MAEEKKLFKVTIDNITVQVEPGTSILMAARSIGGDVVLCPRRIVQVPRGVVQLRSLPPSDPGPAVKVIVVLLRRVSAAVVAIAPLYTWVPPVRTSAPS